MCRRLLYGASAARAMNQERMRAHLRRPARRADAVCIRHVPAPERASRCISEVESELEDRQIGTHHRSCAPSQTLLGQLTLGGI
jgi:hypothetical protein